MSKELTEAQLIERSITKTFRRYLWSKLQIAIGKYEMIKPGDKIAVCISGGKDSILLAKEMQMYQRYGLADFECVFLVMDPGYAPANRKKIEENLKRLEIPAVIFETNIFDVANNLNRKPCYMCSRMRRGALYAKAKELGCNKIALGHHLNDAIETTVMSMFWSSKLETIVPKCHSENFEGMELIRPLYCTKEEDIIRWCKHNHLEFIQCACRFTEQCGLTGRDAVQSKRKETKELIRSLMKDNPEIEDHIFQALHSVQLETFPGYKRHQEMHSMLEDYDNLVAPIRNEKKMLEK